MQRRLWLSVLRRVMEAQKVRQRVPSTNGHASPDAKTGELPVQKTKGQHSTAWVAGGDVENRPVNCAVAHGGPECGESGNDGPEDIMGSVDELDVCISDTVQRELLAVEDVLGLLPEQQTLRSYKSLLVKHMETTSFKVRCAVRAVLCCAV